MPPIPMLARAAVVYGLLSVVFAGHMAGQEVAQRQPLRPLAIEDVVATVHFQEHGELGVISPDGALLAYPACDPRRILKDSTGRVSATVNSALSSLGCDLYVTALADGSTHTVARSERGGHWAPSWSPDGQRLAFLSDRDGVARVWIWERPTGRLRRVSAVETRTRLAFERPLWTADGRALVVKLLTTGVASSALTAGTQEIAPPSDAVPGSTLRLYRSAPPRFAQDTVAAPPSTTVPEAPKYEDFAVMDVASGQIRRIRSRVAPRWYQLSPDGRWLAFLEQTDHSNVDAVYALRVIELATGAERTLASDIRQEWPGAVTWAPNSRLLAYTSRPAPSDSSRNDVTIASPLGAASGAGSELYVVAVDDGEPRRFTGVPGPVLSSLYLGPLWTSRSDGLVVAGQRRLWRADLASGTITNVPASRSVDYILRAADRRTYWSPDGGTSLYVLTRDSITMQAGYAAIDLRTGATRTVLQDRRGFGSEFSPPLVTPRGDAVVYLSYSASQGPDLWVAGGDFQAPRPLTRLNPQLERYTFGKAQLVEYRSLDGRPLRGTLLLPAGHEPGKRYPLIVLVYASDMGSHGINSFGLLGGAYNLQMLSTRGYAVLWPDIPVHVGTPMRDLMKSVMPAIDKVVELGIADPERLAVTGQSNGGYSTLALLVQTARFKAAVMNAGFGDLVGFYGWMNPRDGSGGWQHWLEHRGGAMGVPPWEAPLRYVENSPVFYLDRVQTPLIIQAGSADAAIVPFSDQVFVGLKRLQKDVTYLRYDGEGHVLTQYPNLIDYWQRVIAFLDEKLKGVPTTAPQLGHQ